MKREFTASVYLINNQKVLLLFHPKLHKWLPPGGHVEPDETPAEAARREVLEETGLELEFILQENVWVEAWNARSIERPYLCLLENIPAYHNVPEHQHVDFVFVGKPLKDISLMLPNCRWFDWETLQTLQPEKDIFGETLQVIDQLLHGFVKSWETALETTSIK